MSNDKFQQWAESKFEGLSKDDLIAAGEILGENFPRQMLERTMRIKLCEKMGTTPMEDITPVKAPPPTRGNGVFDHKPNLTNGEAWGGKMYHVLVYPPPENTEQSTQFFTLVWEGMPRVYSYNMKLSIPAPYLNVLRDSVKKSTTQREVKNPEGHLIRMENIDVPMPRYSTQFMGPVAGTENLPESLLEYWQIQASKHKNFRGMNRRILTMIRADLFGPAPRDFYKDLTDQDILYDIHTFLGIDQAEGHEEA